MVKRLLFSFSAPAARFKYLAQSVQKKVPPVRGEHACGSSRALFSRC